jgi:hypothetical protein
MLPPDTLVPLVGMLIVFGATGSVLILRGPLGRALARRIEGTSVDADARRVEELEQRVAQLEAEHGRVAELEERLDFAERLLAQQRGAAAQLTEGSR